MTDDRERTDGASGDRQRTDQGSGGQSTAGTLQEAVGMSIPDDHVGAFVAEVFEDAELTTSWADVVDAMVAPEARDAWESMSATEQVREILEMADSYDRRAADILADIDTDGDDPGGEKRSRFREAMRRRRNADAFRNGVASAYGDGVVDDDELVRAVEAADFDTDAIARREDELDRVTSAYEFDYRPYGGTLIQETDSTTEDTDIPETF